PGQSAGGSTLATQLEKYRHSPDGLTLSGFEVQVFARAEECLAHLPEHFPGVVLTDVRMPGMSGLELL
ncbi:helix-turn-helix, Fis-type, partial [Pseudomonas syringae pv. pisi str. 1704B]